MKCLRRLASPFFRTHHKLAHLYVRVALSSSRVSTDSGMAFRALRRRRRATDRSRETRDIREPTP